VLFTMRSDSLDNINNMFNWLQGSNNLGGFSVDIDDLAQFYNKDPNKFAGPEPFSERVQYMFRSKKPDGTLGLPFPEDANDQFTNGGGQGAPTGSLSTQQQSAFLPDPFFGATDFQNNFDPDLLAQGTKQFRVGYSHFGVIGNLQRGGTF